MGFLIWMILPLIVMVSAAVYLYRKVYGAVCFFCGKLSGKKRHVIAAGADAVLILPAAADLILPASAARGLWLVGLLYMTVFLLAQDAVVLVVKKCRRNRPFSFRIKAVCRSGILAVLAAVLSVGYGWSNMHHIIKTEYTVYAQNEIREEGYTIVFFSDLHYGTTLSREQFRQAADAIEGEKPDMVILGGDIVDERTGLARMQEAFEIMGNIDARYGIFYVYGNHDKNEYAKNPGYTAAQLEDTVRQAGICILEDETYEINGEITLIGRADRGYDPGMRRSVAELTENTDAGMERILIDHQPVEYAEVRESGCGLMLSGHTHAGQVWPLGMLAELFQTNELTYGCRKEGSLTEVVSSGIAGWGYPVRTERHSEYVVIHLINPPEAASSSSVGGMSGGVRCPGSGGKLLERPEQSNDQEGKQKCE